MAVTKDIFILFCENSSLRGVGKFAKSKTIVLKILWLTFVIIMVACLAWSIAWISRDYMEYNTIVQSTIETNANSPFPAITVCNMYPFGADAMKFWRNESVQSPRDFNIMIRKISEHFFNHGSFENAKQILFYDRTNIYYQNLTVTESNKLSHREKDMFFYCISAIGPRNSMGRTMKECMLTVHKFSHHLYFNCYSISAKHSNETTEVSLIINMKSKSKSESVYEEAFVADVFRQAIGVRVVIHEPKTYPHVERSGIHILPNSMAEIMYHPYEWLEANTPTDQCIFPHEETRIPDLGDHFHYKSDDCVSLHINKIVAERCKCILAYYPRPIIPSTEVPYCGQFDMNITKTGVRFACLSELRIRELSKEIRKEKCKPRCHYHAYETQISFTKWRPTDWQLYWLFQNSDAFNYVSEVSEMKNDTIKQNGTDELYQYYTDHIRSYYNATSLHNKTYKLWKHDTDSYVYLTVKRGSFDKEVRHEILQTTFAALCSRIGGICSLYLGLTCAFFMELVEFCILVKNRATERE